MGQQAMAAHQALPMPFERARTQLLLGQLQRRQRQKDVATTTLTEALASFEGMNAALWLDRTRNELARIRVNPTRALLLTPSEQRVAELAASGMTNRDIGAAVFTSPKTVDAHLARIYRKLGIHTRAELGRALYQQIEREPRVPSGSAYTMPASCLPMSLAVRSNCLRLVNSWTPRAIIPPRSSSKAKPGSARPPCG
jgi:DNA-binding CsgD family transcriptional regulator